ncbi:hypothetical protein [Labrenzia sp. PHM005]|uniref:hypothetical protein n=1 Tax=Labrenzia sp. PHM005 TaxID=2590016 RepID=UPI0011403C55|nr:hypothetical protein [Labrenzia sp. PHM005]QDG76707.1 hypothetical protein FJ695_12960 [Labrenzia sp. PHM005]
MRRSFIFAQSKLAGQFRSGSEMNLADPDCKDPRLSGASSGVVGVLECTIYALCRSVLEGGGDILYGKVNRALMAGWKSEMAGLRHSHSDARSPNLIAVEAKPQVAVSKPSATYDRQILDGKINLDKY